MKECVKEVAMMMVMVMIWPSLLGSLFCGWLRSPSVLMCEEQDWDVTGQGTASRICGAGLRYNEQDQSFVFDFGGQKFTISETVRVF